MNGQRPDGSQKAVQFPFRLFELRDGDMEKFKLDGHLLDPRIFCLTVALRLLQRIVTVDKAGSAFVLMRRRHSLPPCPLNDLGAQQAGDQGRRSGSPA